MQGQTIVQNGVDIAKLWNTYDQAIEFYNSYQLFSQVSQQVIQTLHLNENDLNFDNPVHADLFFKTWEEMCDNNPIDIALKRITFSTGKIQSLLSIKSSIPIINQVFSDTYKKLKEPFIQEVMLSFFPGEINQELHSYLSSQLFATPKNKYEIIQTIKSIFKENGKKISQEAEATIEQIFKAKVEQPFLDNLTYNFEKNLKEKLEAFNQSNKEALEATLQEYKLLLKQEARAVRQQNINENMLAVQQAGAITSNIAFILGKEQLASDIAFVASSSSLLMNAIPRISEIHSAGGIQAALRQMGQPDSIFTNLASIVNPYLTIANIGISTLTYIISRKKEGQSIQPAIYNAIRQLFGFVIEFKQEMHARFDHLEKILLNQHQEILETLNNLGNDVQQVMIACDSIYKNLVDSYRRNWESMRDLSTVKDKLIESEGKYEEYLAKYGNQLGDMTLNYYIELCKAFINAGNQQYAVGKIDGAKPFTIEQLQSLEPEDNIFTLYSYYSHHTESSEKISHLSNEHKLYNPAWILTGIDLYLRWLRANSRLKLQELPYIKILRNRLQTINDFSQVLANDNKFFSLLFEESLKFLSDFKEVIIDYDRKLIDELNRQARQRILDERDYMTGLPDNVPYKAQTPGTSGKHFHAYQDFTPHNYGSGFAGLKQAYIRELETYYQNFNLNISLLKEYTSSDLILIKKLKLFARPNQHNLGDYVHKVIPFPLTDKHILPLLLLNNAFIAEYFGRGKVHITYKNDRLLGAYQTNYCNAGRDFSHFHTHDDTMTVCHLMDAELVVTFVSQEQKITLHHLRRHISDRWADWRRIDEVNKQYNFPSFLTASFVPQNLPHSNMQYDELLQEFEKNSALNELDNQISIGVRDQRDKIIHMLNKALKLGGTLFERFNQFRLNLFFIKSYATLIGLDVHQELLIEPTTFQEKFEGAIHTGKIDEFFVYLEGKIKLTWGIIENHLASSIEKTYSGVKNKINALIAIEEQLKGARERVPFFENEDDAIVGQDNIEKRSSDFIKKLIKQPSLLNDIFANAEEQVLFLDVLANIRQPFLFQRLLAIAPPRVKETLMNLISLQPIQQVTNGYSERFNPVSDAIECQDDDLLSSTNCHTHRNEQSDRSQTFVHYNDKIVVGGVQAAEIIYYESTYISDTNVLLDTLYAPSQSSEMSNESISPNNSSSTQYENTLFDAATWDPIVQTHLETGEPIFIYRVFKDNSEVGSLSFYKHPLLCRSATEERHNIIAATGIFTHLNLQVDSIEEICASLPPTLFDNIVNSVTNGGQVGAVRGLANVVGYTLKSQHMSEDTAEYLSQFIYYGGYFLLRYQNHIMQQEYADFQTTLNAIFKASFETGSLVVVNTFINKLSQAANRISHHANERGWTKTGSMFKFFKNVMPYGAYAVNACQQGITNVTASIAAGSIAQTTIEMAGKSIVNRIFKK